MLKIKLGKFYCLGFCFILFCHQTIGGNMVQVNENISLPDPVKVGDKSLEKLLQQRRSVRDYQQGKVLLAEIGQLLWAAQGITHPLGMRTAPSAGALYPLELYVVAGNVEGLNPGVYYYSPASHRLAKTSGNDIREVLAQAAVGQSWISDAAAIVVFAARYERTTWKYGRRGVRYVHIEVGHAAQNLFLQAEALGLGTVVVGAFDDDKVAALQQFPADVQPLILMPLGRK